jgi:hypothetical protein
MKLFEYFYLGKPVVATPILELANHSALVNIGNSPEQWQSLIRSALKRPLPTNLKNSQRKLAENNSWKNKIAEIGNIMSTH